MPRNKANDGLGEMDVEIVANDIPACVGGGAAQQGVEKTSKVLLGPGVADHPGDFAGRDIETGDQGLRAVAAILEFAPLDHARLHRQPRCDALQCLNAGHLVLSAACKITRARNANCCEVEWARTSASSASRCAGKTITASAASQGIATCPLSFRFVMPRRRRFDSCFVAGKQPRSYYLRTFTQGGVATSARRY